MGTNSSLPFTLDTMKVGKAQSPNIGISAKPAPFFGPIGTSIARGPALCAIKNFRFDNAKMFAATVLASAWADTNDFHPGESAQSPSA
jgi:hypothetical protein